MKKLIKIYKSIPGVIILLAVLVPFVGNFFVSNTHLLDNRPLNQRPTTFDKDFSKDFEAYYNDSFAWRKSLLKRYVKLQKKLKIDAGRYFSGLDGWMFYDSAKVSDGNSIIDYKGEAYYNNKEMEQIKQGVVAARDFYAKRGIKYMLVIAPNKENVYPEYMPTTMQKVRKSDKSRADMVAEYLNEHSDVEVLDLKDKLISSKDDYEAPLYFKRDTHWNALGGYVGYGEIAKGLVKLGFRAPFKAATPSMIKADGKQAVDMDMSATETKYKVDYLATVNTNRVVNEDNEKLMVYKAPDAPIKATILLIRDSFAAELIPYFSKAFTTSVFLHRSDKAHNEMDKYLKEYKVNVVVDEVVERRVDKLLDYAKTYGEKK